jgi:hypothetical protein
MSAENQLKVLENAVAQWRVGNPSFETSPSGQGYAAKLKALREKAGNDETVRIAKMLEKKGLAPHGTVAAAQVTKLEAEMKDKDSDIAKLRKDVRSRDAVIQNYKDTRAEHKKTIERLEATIGWLEGELRVAEKQPPRGSGGDDEGLRARLKEVTEKLDEAKRENRQLVSGGLGVIVPDAPAFLDDAADCIRLAAKCRVLQVARLFASAGSPEHKEIQDGLNLELDDLAFSKRLEAVHLDRREVDEDVLARVLFNEAITLGVIEPLDLPSRHARCLLRGGSRPHRCCGTNRDGLRPPI